MPYSPPAAAASSLAIKLEDVAVASRPVMNYHAGTNVTLGVVDDSGAGEVDVTINAALSASTPDWAWNPRDLNMLAWTFPPPLWGGNGSAPTAGARYYMKMPILETVTLANLHYGVSTLGTGAQLPVNVLAGIGTISAGTWTLCGTTVDQSTAVQTTGFKTAALSATGPGLTVTGGASKFLYATFLIQTQSTTPVQLARSSNSNILVGPMAASDGFYSAVQGAGQTTLAASQALSGMASVGFGFWFGVS